MFKNSKHGLVETKIDLHFYYNCVVHRLMKQLDVIVSPPAFPLNPYLTLTKLHDL